MKIIVITGTSSGIGKETAKYFASKGWNVVATMRNIQKAQELKDLDYVYIYFFGRGLIGLFIKILLNS